MTLSLPIETHPNSYQEFYQFRCLKCDDGNGPGGKSSQKNVCGVHACLVVLFEPFKHPDLLVHFIAIYV